MNNDAYNNLEKKGFSGLLEILENKKIDVKPLIFMICVFRIESHIRKESSYRGVGIYLSGYIKNLKTIFELTKKITSHKNNALIESDIKKIEALKDDNLNIVWGYKIKRGFFDTTKAGNDKNYEKCYKIIEMCFNDDWDKWMSKEIFIRTCRINGDYAIRLNKVRNLIKSGEFKDFLSGFFKRIPIINSIILDDLIRQQIREFDGSEELLEFLFESWGSGISRLVQQYYYKNKNISKESKEKLDIVDFKPVNDKISIYKNYIKSLNENSAFPALIKKLENICNDNFTIEKYPKDIIITSGRNKGRPQETSDDIKIIKLIKTILKEKASLEIISHIISFLGFEGWIRPSYNKESKQWKSLLPKNIYNDNYYLRLKAVNTIDDLKDYNLGRFTYYDILEFYKKEFKWDYDSDIPLSAFCIACNACKNKNYIGCLKNMNCALYSRYAMSLELNPAVKLKFLF